MAERWVLNASPVIVLTRLGLENLFFELADEIVLPQAVALEIQAGPSADLAQQALAAGQFTIVDTPPPPTPVRPTA